MNFKKIILISVLIGWNLFNKASAEDLNNAKLKAGPKHKIYTIFSDGYSKKDGVFIIVHGLNNKPEVMNELIGLVNVGGSSAIRVELTAHESDEGRESSNFIFRKISAKSWLEDVEDAFLQAQEQFPNQPISVLGFSLGGSTLIRYLDLHPETKINKAFFIAPAIGVFKFTHLIEIFSPLKYLGIPSISFAPKGYRRSMFPSFRIYDGLFDMYDDVQTLSQNKNLKTANPVFFLADGDELIDRDKVNDWIKRNNLEKESKVIEIKFDKGSEPEYRHQIIDKVSVGEKNWEVFREELKERKASVPALCTP